MKKYISNSQLSINVTMASNNSLHVRFTPLTGGGSVFYSDDKDIQEALERHPKFNKLFRIDPYYIEKPVKTAKKSTSNTASKSFRKVKVSCVDDAKDYMADKYGTSRTQMKSIAEIKTVAAEKGVEFEGI